MDHGERRREHADVDTTRFQQLYRTQLYFLLEIVFAEEMEMWEKDLP